MEELNSSLKLDLGGFSTEGRQKRWVLMGRLRKSESKK